MHYEGLTHVICHLMPFEAALKQCLLCKARHKNKGDLKCAIYTLLKNAGLFQPKLGSNIGKPKCWVKNII